MDIFSEILGERETGDEWDETGVGIALKRIVICESMSGRVAVSKQFLTECYECARKRDDVKAFDYFSMKSAVDKENVTCKQSEMGKDTAVESVIDLAGRTPLVRLSRLEAKYGLKCNLYGKFEAASGGGSVKDRIAREMIGIPEAAGKIKPGDIIIESTSGNTGLALAAVCAVKGYPLVVFMPEKMSKEKERTLMALGAIVFRTRSAALWSDGDSHFSLARKMEAEINSRTAKTGLRAYYVDQFSNSGNVTAHYFGTAEELLAQLNGKVDGFVAGIGTGGTITGTAMRLKEVLPNCKIYGADPLGSLLHYPVDKLDPANIRSFEVEGIGYDFHPSTFEPNLVDDWVVVDDQSSFQCARDLIRYEALLVGGSSGTALSAAIKIGKKMQPGQNLVVLFADSVRNYITKFLSDDWLVVHGFLPPTAHPLAESTAEFNKLTIKEATASLTLRPFSTLHRFPNTLTVRDLYPKLESGFHCVVYNAATKVPCGLISKADLIPHILDDRLDKPLSSVAEPQTLLIMSMDSSLQAVWIVMDAACEARKSRSAVIVLSEKIRPDRNLPDALKDFQTCEDNESVIITQEQLSDVISSRRALSH